MLWWEFILFLSCLFPLIIFLYYIPEIFIRVHAILELCCWLTHTTYVFKVISLKGLVSIPPSEQMLLFLAESEGAGTLGITGMFGLPLLLIFNYFYLRVFGSLRITFLLNVIIVFFGG